jgi:DNA-binding FadR family transcriptional regulator
MATTSRSKAERALKAGELAAAHLRREIVTGELREGEALPSEAALMQRFGISRPTLREALRILESESIITIKRGSRGGAHVLIPDVAAAGRYAGALLQYRGTTLADLYQARAQLEAAGAEMLATKRSAADLQKLENALAEGEALVSDPLAYAEKQELQFHRLVMTLAGNQTMRVLLDMLLSIMELHNQSFLRAHPPDENSVAVVRVTQNAHAKMVKLVRQRAADKAGAFWQRHVSLVGEYMISDPQETVLDVLS